MALIQSLQNAITAAVEALGYKSFDGTIDEYISTDNKYKSVVCVSDTGGAFEDPDDSPRQYETSVSFVLGVTVEKPTGARVEARSMLDALLDTVPDMTCGTLVPIVKSWDAEEDESQTRARYTLRIEYNGLVEY